jgi:hypothetical protein
VSTIQLTWDGLCGCYVAIEKSWTAEFIGESPLRGLEAHIIDQLKLPQVYGRYCSIIQSSGMGKSRLLDEFSKGYFLIPINLRSADSQGLSYQFYFRSPLHLSQAIPLPTSPCVTTSGRIRVASCEERPTL